MDGHMHSFSCSHQGFSSFEGVLKREGSVADMSNLDGNDNFVPHKDRGFVIGFSMHDGQEIICPFKHFLEAPTEFFEQILVGVMDDLKLIGKENNACGIGVVQSDLCFVGEHSSDYIKSLTNTKKIVL